MNEPLDIAIDGRGVAVVTLNQPDRHNALSAGMMDALVAMAHSLGGNPDVRAVILTGAGKSFCAGGDLAWMREQFAAGDVAKEAAARKLADMLRTLDQMPKPLIARVNGQAFGGGLGLMSVCDVAIGLSGAKFGFTETRLGLTPATIGPYVLARMGAAKARRVFMSSRLFDGDEAVHLNLLADAVADMAALDHRVQQEVEPYLSCAPGAVADAKALIHALSRQIDDTVIAHTVAALSERWADSEAQEGISAFFERRKPQWNKG